MRYGYLGLLITLLFAVGEARASITYQQAQVMVGLSGLPIDARTFLEVANNCSGTYSSGGVTIDANQDSEYCRLTMTFESSLQTLRGVFIVGSDGSQWSFFGSERAWTWITIIALGDTSFARVTVETSDGYFETRLVQCVDGVCRPANDEDDIDWGDVP